MSCSAGSRRHFAGIAGVAIRTGDARRLTCVRLVGATSALDRDSRARRAVVASGTSIGRSSRLFLSFRAEVASVAVKCSSCEALGRAVLSSCAWCAVALSS